MPRVFGANFLPLIMVMCVAFFACNKPSDIGLDVQPEGDLLNVVYSDTTKIISFAKQEDSLRTDEVSVNMLGIFNDPLFGTTSTSIYAQLLLSNINPDFGTNPLIDSVALSLVYSPNYYGKLDAQTLKVFEVTDTMYYDSAYYSNTHLNKSTTDLANTYVFTPKPLDSVIVEGVKRKPMLRVLLSNTLGQTLLNNQSQMTSDAEFTSFFKGLYIKTDDAPAIDQGGILYMNLADALSKLTVYYHNDVDDSLKFDFLIGTKAARFTNISHDYSSMAHITNQLADSTLGQTVTYVQAAAGLKTKIWFPNLHHYTDSGAIALNKAELILNIDPVSVASYSPPSNLVLLGIDSLGKSYTLNDAVEGSEHFGGSYNSTTKQIKFNITRHLQFVLDKKVKNYGFYLVTSGASVQANRVMIYGGDNTTLPIKLKLTYTKLY